MIQVGSFNQIYFKLIIEKMITSKDLQKKREKKYIYCIYVHTQERLYCDYSLLWGF